MRHKEKEEIGKNGSHDAADDNLNFHEHQDGSASPDASPTGYHRAEGDSELDHRSEAGKQSLARSTSHASRVSSRTVRAASHRRLQGSYDLPDDYVNLDELAAPSPVENPDEGPLYRHISLEHTRSQEQAYRKSAEIRRKAAKEHPEEAKEAEENKVQDVSKVVTQLYVISYLILFSLLGTLARLGLQAITFYPGAPVAFSELWANFGGSLFMGFLSEDRMLFKDEWGTPMYHQQIQKAKKQKQDEETGSGSDQFVDLQAAKKAHAATKKTVPLYIGLATGFCGCFTSFSSFIRDVFLGLSNDLPTPLNHPSDYRLASATVGSTVPRNGGYSFMALLAIIIITVGLCISALHIGAHIAIALEPFTPSLPYKFCRKVLDPFAVFLAWGCWLGAILLAIFPPDRNSAPPEIWRGRAVFALVFAPLGCLGRFYASLYLNGKIASFPLGTFVVNIFGTVILGMSYDLQRVPLGGVIGCQVLQGIEDGFCGCLTTVSTWVSELSSLRRRHSYQYGAASVIVGLCFMIVIMGSMKWTIGFSDLQCVK
ncbi:CrcB-like protein-domain-containing protein [Cadophora sp. MPI-SDFR-AT-0126]|nr:CrcB-like protein-domain-containing protein [Leotiomycetes sp. MPI-SDFR-AT-0126]